MISVLSSNFNSVAVQALNKAQSLGVRASQNLSAGSKSSLVSQDMDVTALSVRTNTAKTINSRVTDSLAGALTYLEVQASSVKKMSDIVGRMSELVTRMGDSTKSSSDLDNYMTQFNGLRQDLVAARKEQFGDIPLHDRSGSSTPLQVSLDGSATNLMSLTQSDFLSHGAGAMLALVGSTVQDFEVTVVPQVTDTTGYDDETIPASNTPASGTLSGQEGGGTEVTNSPKALVQWGVGPLNNLLSSMANLLSINASQQATLLDAIDASKRRGFDLEEAGSRLSDVDVARELTDLAKSNLRTHAGASAMAQANATAGTVARALYGRVGSGIQWYLPV